MKTETPLMKQYNAIKAKYPDCLLLFRIGDFYETFGPDAAKISELLGIILVHPEDSEKPELSGFPAFQLENYLPKLVSAGHKVAICDQLH